MAHDHNLITRNDVKSLMRFEWDDLHFASNLDLFYRRKEITTLANNKTIVTIKRWLTEKVLLTRYLLKEDEKGVAHPKKGYMKHLYREILLITDMAPTFIQYDCWKKGDEII